MTKPLKISVILFSIIAVLAIACTILVLRADKIIVNMADSQLKAMISDKQLPLQYGKIGVHLLQGKLWVDDVTFCLEQKDSLSGDSAQVKLDVERIYCGRIHWNRLVKEKVLYVDALRLIRPNISCWNMKEALQAMPKTEKDSAKQSVNIPLQSAHIGQVSIVDGSVSLAQRSDKLHLNTDNLSLSVFDIAYNFRDSLFSYSDSLYLIEIGQTDFTTPNGMFKLSLGGLSANNSGSITLTDIRGGNTVEKSKYAERMGKVPVSWASFDVQEIRTSPVNIIRMAKAAEINIDSLYVKARQASIYRDNQYKPKKPYPMPQDGLLKMKMPMRVGYADIALQKMLIELTLTGKTVGQLELSKMMAKVSNITNKQGKTISAKINTMVEATGKADVALSLTVNRQCNFSMKANMLNTNGEAFDNFLKPLFGVAVQCNISEINMDYKGDRRKAVGTYCMRYDGLKLNVLKQNGPIEKLSKYSGVINTFAPAIILDRNPRKAGAEPQAYDVEWEHNEWKNFAVYMMGPMIDGMIQSVLPPNIAKSIKKKFTAANQ